MVILLLFVVINPSSFKCFISLIIALLSTDKKSAKWVYEIFSIVIADKVGTEEHMNIKYKTDKEYYNHFKRLKNRSLYDTGVNIEESDNVLVLQTCIYGKYKGKLLVIVAKKVKEN